MPISTAPTQISPRNQRVLIAGGSRGIGLAIADAFVRNGAQVSLCARNADGLAKAAQTLAPHGTPVHTFACDLSDAAQIAAYVQAAAQALDGLDVVINNASGYGHGNDDASWQAGLDVDLMAAVRCNRAALPYLRNSDAAVILNISSINAQRPTPRAIAYSTAKAALNYYTTTLAAELARERIRVNAIAPGSIEFPDGLWERRRDEEPELYARIRDSIPFGGFGQVQHIADAALFLASPQARWITGQVLAVDGGQSLGRERDIVLAKIPIRCTPIRRSVPARDQALSVTPPRAQACSYEQRATGYPQHRREDRQVLVDGGRSLGRERDIVLAKMPIRCT